MVLFPTGESSDRAPMITIAGDTISRTDLFGAAAGVSERVAGADVAAIWATPSVDTAIAVVGCLPGRGSRSYRSRPTPASESSAICWADSAARIWIGRRPADLPSELASFTVDRARQGYAAG